MEKKFTRKMIEGFNQVMKDAESVIRLEKRVYEEIVDITLCSKSMVDSFIINPTQNFYSMLEGYFFQEYNITISYNNTGSCFWIK